MIFSQQERFSSKPSIDVNHSDIYVPPSMLSSKGTKIVDSWCGIDSPRLVIFNFIYLYYIKAPFKIFYS